MPTGDEDKIKGTMDDTKGRAKKAWGEVTDDSETKREGAMDKAKGKIEDAKGRVKNAIDEMKK
jgi:uncharacterized protein YjbJ (UPF0337 family)